MATCFFLLSLFEREKGRETMRKISSVIMACAMCLSMTVVGTVAPQVAVQAEETATVELKEAPTETPTLDKDFGYEWYLIQ